MTITGNLLRVSAKRDYWEIVEEDEYWVRLFEIGLPDHEVNAVS